MHRKLTIFLFYIICIFLLLSFVSSGGIKISPLKYYAQIDIGEMNCTDVWVSPDSKLSIKTRWSITGGQDISNYNLADRDVDIKIIFNKTNNMKYNICFQAKKSGRFYGGILFLQEESLIGMGMWVELNVTGKSITESISLITGNAINKKNTTNLGLILIFVLLLTVLAILILKRNSPSIPK